MKARIWADFSYCRVCHSYMDGRQLYFLSAINLQDSFACLISSVLHQKPVKLVLRPRGQAVGTQDTFEREKQKVMSRTDDYDSAT